MEYPCIKCHNNALFAFFETHFAYFESLPSIDYHGWCVVIAANNQDVLIRLITVESCECRHHHFVTATYLQLVQREQRVIVAGLLGLEFVEHAI